MNDTTAEIKVGDSVRALAGDHEGKVGTVMRVCTVSDTPTALVKFSDGSADYLRTEELEKAKGGKE